MTGDEVSPANVRTEVERIRTLTGDPEVAHGAEDAVWVAVLEAIRDATSDPWARLLAKEALETLSIDFERWSA